MVFTAESVRERHTTPEAPPQGADAPGHVVPLPQESGGRIEIGDHRVGVCQVLSHQGTVLGGGGSDLPGIEIGSKGDVTLGRHRVGDLADPVHQAVPLVDQDQRGEGPLALGDGQVADRCVIAGVVGNRLARQRGSRTENRRRQDAFGRRGLRGWRVPGAGGSCEENRQSERQPVPCHALCRRRQLVGPYGAARKRDPVKLPDRCHDSSLPDGGGSKIVAVHETMAVHEPCARLKARGQTSITRAGPDRERPETCKRDKDALKLLDFERKKVEASAPRSSQITPHF